MFEHYIKTILACGPITMSPNNVRQVLHVPSLGKYAYFHEVYPPIKDDELEIIRRFYGARLHSDHVALFRLTSGLHLFNGDLSVYGFRHNLNRDSLRPEPFDVMAPTGYLGKDPVMIESVRVAFYSSDGSAMWLHSKTGKVVHRDRRTFAEIGAGWPTLLEALTSEYARFAPAYDKNGIRLRPVG